METNNKLMSEQIDQLACALAKAQAEFSIAGLNQKNDFFKRNYADFESIIAASRPALTKYGLSVIQSPFVLEDGNSYLITILMHNSGQWIKSKAKHNPLKTDVQSLSAYNTYLKRMCYTSLVGVVTGEYDDDAESVMDRNYSPQKINTDKISAETIKALKCFSVDYQNKILEYNKIEKFEDMTIDQYNQWKQKVSQKKSAE